MNLRQFIPSLEPIKDKDFNFTFSVFTPLYNAEKTIERVHQSLLNQSFTDFEWIIINDGSSDKSHDVIQNIVASSPLTINYINNASNKHKMACFFQAIHIANGRLFLTFDADDECLPDSLEIFNTEYYTLSKEQRSDIIAVTGLCKDQNGNTIGSQFPSNPLISNPFEIKAIKNIKGEKWGFTRTTHLQSIKFDDCFIVNGFMMEGIIWNLLAKHGYQTKYINTVVRIYHTNVANSISSVGDDKTALGSVVYYVALYNWFFKSHARKAPMFFFKRLYFLLSKSKFLDLNLKNYTTSIDSFLIKFLVVLLWPFRKFFK
ncbi:glycosyltransferase family 2 protein [Psychroserpens burtonensis]|uniref:Glycosyltransferase family 2 protein n=1 Tax=Psychroserpens burtonensis TaxID=49278 RepID=A0A5C7BDY5_9FLAO|nr:glycosyltransferase family 2 protein [Psychroserpens burtonensis]TXE20248.1 glycosyltransferase family 2 protein [Psychroserpens burtonensis]